MSVSPLLTAVPPEWVRVPPLRLRFVSWALTRASPSTSLKVKSPEAKLSGVSSLVLTRIVAGDRDVVDGGDVDGHRGRDGAAATVVDLEVEGGKRQTVLVGRRGVDQGVELGGGERVAVVDRRAAGVGQRAAVEVEVGELGTDQGIAFDVA